MHPWLKLNLIVAASLITAGNMLSQSLETNSTISPLVKDVDIEGRTLHLALYGHGSPAVIVESGLGEPAVESGTWNAVIASVAKTTTVCVYDRAGLGKSGAMTNASRTTEDVVRDLHLLLPKTGIRLPYILVGHSIGGFTVRLFAGKYPKEVAGLVLVDSSYPDQWAKMLAVMPPESTSEPESVKNLRTFLTTRIADPKTNPEHLDMIRSSREVSAVTNLANMPLVVVSHSRSWSVDPALPKSISDKFEGLWEIWQEDLCHLSTRSSHQVAAKAGHYVHSEDPKLVIDAISQVIGDVKKTPVK